MSALFDNFKELMLGGGTHTLPDLDSGDIRLVCIDTADDDPNTSTDVDLADIAAAVVATSGALQSTSVTDGTFDHADITISSVSGDQFEEIVYYGHTGTSSTSPLICVIDSGTGLPFSPSGGDIEIRPNASGVFSL